MASDARPPDRSATHSCQLCGRPVPEASIAWMFETTRRGPTWTCPDCARTHLRSIESKLDQEYW